MKLVSIFGVLFIIVIASGCTKDKSVTDVQPEPVAEQPKLAKLSVGDCFVDNKPESLVFKVLEVGDKSAFVCGYIEYEDYMFRQCQAYYYQQLARTYEHMIERVNCPESINPYFRRKKRGKK